MLELSVMMRLIEEVEKCPPLWSVSYDGGFGQSPLKQQAWKEVSRKLYPVVKKYSSSESAIITALENRWNAVRIEFIQQLDLPTEKRRENPYFEKLRFLEYNAIAVPEEERVIDASLELLNLETNSGEIFVFETRLYQLDGPNFDEDQMFLTSLLPTIRKLTISQKLNFKLEVMRLLKNMYIFNN